METIINKVIEFKEFEDSKELMIGTIIDKIKCNNNTMYLVKTFDNKVTDVNPSFITKIIGQPIVTSIPEGDNYFPKLNSFTPEVRATIVTKIKLILDNPNAVIHVSPESFEHTCIDMVSKIAAKLGYANTSEEMKKWNDATNKYFNTYFDFDE